MLSEKERAIAVAMKAVYWCAKEQFAIHKYPSLMSLLDDLETPHVDDLHRGENATYVSERSAEDLLYSISSTITDFNTQKARDSSVYSILID